MRSKYQITTRPGSPAACLQTLAGQLSIKVKTFQAHDGLGWEAKIKVPMLRGTHMPMTIVDDGWGGGLMIHFDPPCGVGRGNDEAGPIKEYAKKAADEGLRIDGTFTDIDSSDFNWECWIEEIVNWVLMTKDIRGRCLGNVCHSTATSGSFIEYRRRHKANAHPGTVAEDERAIIEKIFASVEGEVDWIIGLTSAMSISTAHHNWETVAASA